MSERSETHESGGDARDGGEEVPATGADDLEQDAANRFPDDEDSTHLESG